MRGGSERLEEGKESPDEVGVVYCDGCGRIWTRWLTVAMQGVGAEAMKELRTVVAQGFAAVAVEP
ncbi:hypothetical protein DY000_02054450 [Brassica cretica]|uniref:Uncharacterized protein n=1 Tax=Brassica cretica TaxID=69181 RepID=A0ABQ7AJN1_BRACR|nr:hypothetical protein DY000_02054450 [Brassica cretica]